MDQQFLEILQSIVARPGMYKIQKVEDFEIFIYAAVLITKDETIAKRWMSGFNEFVIAQVDPSLTQFEWSKIIRLYAGSDTHSISLFRDLFSDYVALNYPSQHSPEV